MRAVTGIALLVAAGLAYAGAAGPDVVLIDDVSHWFAPAEFAHADHLDMADECSSCHHDQEPEDAGACGDCHLAEYDPASPDVPDLKMAYHTLCLGCHDEVGATLECVGCHERAALPAGPELRAGTMR
jgi:predicted CXXCH cytochrome family protein